MKNSSSLFSLPITKFILSESYQIVIQFSSVIQSYPTLCNHMDCSMLGSLSITNSCSLLKLMSMDSVMPSNHLILCRPLLNLSHPISIKVFSNELAHIVGWNYFKAHSPTASPWPKTTILDQEREGEGRTSRLFRKATRLLHGQPQPPGGSHLLRKSSWKSSVVHATPNTNAQETFH